MGPHMSTDNGHQVYWFDLNVNNPENRQLAEQLEKRLLIEVIGLASSDFSKLGQQPHNQERIVMVSGRLKQELIDYVLGNHLQSCLRVIVYCGDKSKHLDANQHKFVHAVVDSSKELLEVLQGLLSKQVSQPIAKPLEATISSSPKDIRAIQVETFPSGTQNYLNELEVQLEPCLLVIYRPIKRQQNKESELFEFELGYNPLQQFAYFKTQVSKELWKLFQGSAANSLVPSSLKEILGQADTFYSYCRALLVLLTHSHEIISHVGKHLFPAYRNLHPAYMNLYLAIFSNFMFFLDKRTSKPVKRLATGAATWPFLRCHHLLQCSNFLVVEPSAVQAPGNLAISINLGQHVVSNSLFAPYVQLPNGRLVYAPYSRFIIKSIDRTKEETILQVHEVWDRSMPWRTCLPILLAPTSPESIQRWLQEAHSDNDQLRALWMLRYYLDLFLFKDGKPQQLVSRFKDFLNNPGNNSNVPQVACFWMSFDEAVGGKHEIAMPEPVLKDLSQSTVGQYLIELAWRQYRRDNKATANQLVKRYLNIVASNKESETLDINMVARFIQCTTEHSSVHQFQQLIELISQQIGEYNQMTATLYRILACVHLQSRNTKQAEQLFRKSVSGWEYCGITRHTLLSQSLEELAGIHLQRGSEVEWRLLMRKARQSQP